MYLQLQITYIKKSFYNLKIQCWMNNAIIQNIG